MDRGILVSRCKRTGAFLLQPVNTSRRYGGPQSIDLYREVPTDADDESLGETVINLLALSGPTAVAFAEAEHDFGEVSRGAFGIVQVVGRHERSHRGLVCFRSE